MRWNDFRGYWTIDRATHAADLAVRFAAVLVALAALLFFLYRPNVEIESKHQAFIDPNVVATLYKPPPGTDAQGSIGPPALVLAVVNAYNDANAKDLETAAGENPTAAKPPSAKELCQKERDLVMKTFELTSCDAAHPRIGRGHYYERLLLKKSLIDQYPKLKDDELKLAVENLYQAEYIKARVVIKNSGSSDALEVTLRAPDAFGPSKSTKIARGDLLTPYTLSAGDDDEIFFETGRGGEEPRFARVRGLAPAPDRVRFKVDWSSEEGLTAIPEPFLIVACVGALLAWLLLICNDIVITTRKRAESD
jgi:hypothetical protein